MTYTIKIITDYRVILMRKNIMKGRREVIRGAISGKDAREGDIWETSSREWGSK